MTDGWLADTRASYDADAADYAAEVRDLLGRSPWLRATLAVFAELVRDAGGGPVADVGCGPGHVTRFLHGLGVDATGIDLSPEMVALARAHHPGLRFEVGTMTDLDLANGSLDGLLAFWSLIHVPDHHMPAVIEQFDRVLTPGAPLLIGFHVGDRARHFSHGDTEHPLALASYDRRPGQVADWLREAGFTIRAELVMRPDDETPGAIVLASAPPPST